MIIIYDECHRNVRAAQKVYLELFPGDRYSTYETVTIAFHCLRETGFVALRSRTRSRARCNVRETPEAVLAFSL